MGYKETMKERSEAAAAVQATEQVVVTETNTEGQSVAAPEVVVNTETPVYSKFGYNSEEEFSKSYTELKEKATNYEQEVSKYKTIAEQYQGIDGDEDMLRVSILKAKGDDRYKLFAKVALGDDIKDMDLLKMKYKKEFPDKDDKLIEKYILNEYKLNSELPDEEDTHAVERYEENKSLAEMKLNRDAANYRETLMNEFKSIEVPINRKPTEEQIGLMKSEAEKTWIPVNSQLVDILSKNEYKVKVGEEEIPIVFELTAEEKQEVSKMILDYSKDNMLSYSEANVAHVASLAKDAILRKNQNLLVQKVWDEAEAYYDKKLDALKGGATLREISTNNARQSSDNYGSMMEKFLTINK